MWFLLFLLTNFSSWDASPSLETCETSQIEFLPNSPKQESLKDSKVLMIYTIISHLILKSVSRIPLSKFHEVPPGQLASVKLPNSFSQETRLSEGLLLPELKGRGPKKLRLVDGWIFSLRCLVQRKPHPPSNKL